MSPLWPLYGLLFIGACLVLLVRKRRWEILAAGWFLIMLSPKIPAMMDRNFLSDSWVYASSPGLLIPLSFALSAGLASKAYPLRWLSRIVFALLLVFWAGLVHYNVAMRGSDEKNYRWTLRFRPATFAQYKLGVILLKTGRAQEAIPYLESVLSVNPSDLSCQIALGLSYFHAGDRKRAMRLMEALLRKNPQSDIIRENLAEMRRHIRDPFP